MKDSIFEIENIATGGRVFYLQESVTNTFTFLKNCDPKYAVAVAKQYADKRMQEFIRYETNKINQ